MIKGRKIYDPLTDIWSTGYWIPVYQGNRIIRWVPVWGDQKGVEKYGYLYECWLYI